MNEREPQETPEEQPPTDEELDVEGPNESAPGDFDSGEGEPDENGE